MNHRRYLTAEELSERWRRRISERTIANWRHRGEGPIWTRISGRILYAEIDVETWESQQRRGTTREER